MKKIFEHRRTSGAVLSEYLENGARVIEYSDAHADYKIPVLCPTADKESADRLYLGHTLEEVLLSGRDIIGEELTRCGDPSYESLSGVMPRIVGNAYCFIGGAASHASLTVDTSGVVRLQPAMREKEGAILFSPADIADAPGGEVRQYMLGGRLPILINEFSDGVYVTELDYFVEPGDTDRNPSLWVRELKYPVGMPGDAVTRLFAASNSHEFSGGKTVIEIDGRLFYDALADTVAYWLKFLHRGTRFSLPEEELARVAEGALVSAATTFTGPRPHYGHKYYGRELHDNFPPNYIWTLEAACLYGQVRWAREIFSHLIGYGLNDEGRFVYRQGPMLLGSSAAEYGMLLWMIARYAAVLMPSGVGDEERAKLCGMGEEILAHCIPCPEFGGRVLVKMCAEADNNVRVNVYLNNNLWAIRGLFALSELIGDGERYWEMAKLLLANVQEMNGEYAKEDAELGTVVPFRYGYDPIPYTLSNCETDRLPKDVPARERYFYNPPGRRDFDTKEQEITENTYANYRYYPESLSAMLLKKEHADGLYNMRKTLGGNLLGMVRFRSWLDDWTATSYARFLIETDRIEEYLLLLYAHTKHHGHPELLCYYEQVKPYGAMSANDCVPSLLTTPIMCAWIFAYERVGGGLRLLSALPRDWYGRPFSAEGVGTSHGRLDVSSDGEYITVRSEFGMPRGTELVWRCKDTLTREDILACGEAVEDIRKNVLVLKEGIKEFKIKVK